MWKLTRDTTVVRTVPFYILLVSFFQVKYYAHNIFLLKGLLRYIILYTLINFFLYHHHITHEKKHGPCNKTFCWNTSLIYRPPIVPILSQPLSQCLYIITLHMYIFCGSKSPLKSCNKNHIAPCTGCLVSDEPAFCF